MDILEKGPGGRQSADRAGTRTASPLLFTHLVNELELGADWVRSLGCVARPVASKKHLLSFRAFSLSQASLLGIEVVDYATLDGYVHLILFSGTLNTQTGRVSLKPEIDRQVA